MALPQMAAAQALKNVKAPANLPPANFKGVQYVDNNGCIFVRAGRLGDVNWVPRIDQSRKHMCSPSYTATFSTAGGEKPVKAPETQVAALDRGKVEFKGDVIKPVAAPDTSLIKANEASPSAAQAAKEAAERAAKQANDAKLAKQKQAAEKLRAQAIAKKKAEEKAKAAQLAKAIKEAEAVAKQEPKAEPTIFEKIAKEREDRLAKRAAAQAAKKAAAAKAAAAKSESAKVASAAKKVAKPVAVATPKAPQVTALTRAQQAKADREAKAAQRAAARQAKLDEAKRKKAEIAKSKADAAARKTTAFPSGYYVDLNKVLSVSKANKTAQRMLASGYRVQMRKTGKGAKVYVGPFRSESNARVGFYQARNEGFSGAKVVRK